MATTIRDYTNTELSAWDRVKKAFANDWEQTKSDFGSKTSRDMDQDADDTVKQMVGSDDAFENREQAFRFGFTSQSRYQSEFPTWNDSLESHLREEYDGDFNADREHIRHAYGYRSGI